MATMAIKHTNDNNYFADGVVVGKKWRIDPDVISAI